MRKIILGIVAFILLVSLIGIGSLYYKKTDNRTVVETIVLDSLDEYGYIIHDNDTSLYKDKYNDLKILLNEELIDYTKYAELISQMFVIDLYTLDNKVTKNDVGGVEFIYPEYKDNFILNITENLYKYMETDIYGDRKQELPVVSAVTIGQVSESTFTYNEIEFESYKVEVNLDYEEDLEYDESAEVTLIKENDKLYIVEMK